LSEFVEDYFALIGWFPALNRNFNRNRARNP